MKKSLFSLATIILLALPSFSSAQTAQNFNKYVTLGQTDPDVKVLQQTLNSLGYAVSSFGSGSPGNETNYYGPATTKAIQRFQCATLSICSGSPYTNGYGNFGPLTRRTLSQKYSASSIATSPTRTFSTTPSPTPNPIQTPVSSSQTLQTNPYQNYGQLSISSISGPNTIQQGQSATWIINSNASSLNLPAGRIMYSVDWGNGENMVTQSSNVFTHQYPNAGSYGAKFEVYDSMTNGTGYAIVTGYITVSTVNTSSAIQVSSPQGGQTYNIGDNLNIRWSGAMKLISIKNIDINTSRTITQMPLTSAGDTSGSYNYVIPSDILGGFRTGTFSVSVYNSYSTSPEIFNTSAPFKIQASATACSSGQIWSGNQCVTAPSISISQISPTSAASGAQVTITGIGFQQYDQACFSNPNTGVISSCVTPNSLSATQMSLVVPSISASTYTVKARRGDFLESNGLSFVIGSQLQTCPSGQTWNGSSCVTSNQPVTVSVQSPTSGQLFSTGSPIPITWTSNGSSNLTAMILLERFDDSANAGSPVTVKQLTTPNTGSYNLSIGSGDLNTLFPCPNGCTSTSGSASFGVRVIISTTGTPNAQSGRFTISGTATQQPTVTITAPNGGVFQAGTPITIQWTATGINSSNNSLGLAVYRTSTGSTRTFLSTTVSNTGSYTWTIPATAPSGSDYVVYMSTSNTWKQSTPFQIIPQQIIPTVTVTSPNSGESWQIGSTHSITWTATNMGQNVGNIILSNYTQGSADYLRQYPIYYGGSGISYSDSNGSGSYSWTIPSNIPAAQYKISVESSDHSTFDASNSTFNIVAQ